MAMMKVPQHLEFLSECFLEAQSALILSLSTEPQARNSDCLGIAQSMSNVGSQMGQGSGSSVKNQPAMRSGIGSVGQVMASGPGPDKMMSAAGMTQQSSGLNTTETRSSSGKNVLTQQHNARYFKIWEGTLYGQRQGQPKFICRLESYRHPSSSDLLAADWPSTMQIVRLIAKDHMNNKQYVGKAEFLVFQAFNQHGFLGQLQEKKLCAVIQLPSQTLLLSVSDSNKAGRLIGMLFPGDMVVFKTHVSSLQQQQPQKQQIQQIEEIHPIQFQQQNTLQLDQPLHSSTAFCSLLKAVTINPPPFQQDKMVDKSRKCKICGDCAHKRRKPN